jgi:hypothetical protein
MSFFVYEVALDRVRLQVSSAFPADPSFHNRYVTISHRFLKYARALSRLHTITSSDFQFEASSVTR